MGFLDNSGDIILDAVLTDTGRFRLARGDGSFKIAKFALGDEEINYGNYDKNHASGSSYYDLKILQTPILESFTNNTSIMKSKLISISRTNLLYLPRLKRNSKETSYEMLASPTGLLEGAGDHRLITAIACTDETINSCLAAVADTKAAAGVIGGNPNDAAVAKYNPQTYGIRIDQGLDTHEISPSLQIDQDLYETQYLIEIDNRFGSITPPQDGTGLQNAIAYAFKDDDEIASYYVSDADASFVKNNDNTQSGANNQVIAGPRGSYLTFSIRPSLELQQSSYLFDRFGSSETATGASGKMALGDNVSIGSTVFKFIDTIVRVTGVTTGYRIDVPVRFLRKA